MTRNTNVIRKVKRPHRFARWPAYDMGEDRFGLWLFSPAGTIYRGQTGSSIAECEVGQGSRDAGLPVMHLIPRTGWWFAWWCHLDAQQSLVSIDICTPPKLLDGEWRYTDLELDVLAFSDGRVEVHDEAEFEDACQAGGISPEQATAARNAVTDLDGHLRNGSEPFGRVGWEKLDEAQAMSLPPIKLLVDAPM